MKRGVAIVLIVIAGCATHSGSDPRYVVDGVQYGTTDGPFRGRWWSYYERGRSFLNGGFHAEAEADFREAIAMRSKDQRWARTYGLHFTREYFPNRELGVALLGMGRVDEAINSLRLSMDQTKTARAAVYLENALREQIEDAGGDGQNPAIDDVSIERPDFGNPLERVVRATVHDSGYVRALAINGKRIIVPAAQNTVQIEEVVQIDAADSDLVISASDLSGNTTQESVPLDIDVDGPVVSFDEPVIVPGVVRGVIVDRSGISSLRIGGEAVEVVDGSFQLRVATIDTSSPLNYEASDSLGNVNRAPLPVDGAVVTSDRGLGVRFAAYTPGGIGYAPLGDGRVMAYRVAQASDGPISIEWTDLENDTRVPMDSVVARVSVKSKSRSAITALSINGEPCELVPGRSSARVSRYIYLGGDVGAHELRCEAMDESGARGESTLVVERVLSDVEKGLPVRTVLLDAEAGLVASSDSANMAQYVIRGFTRSLEDAQRAQVVNRELLPHVLLEQELSTLSEDGGVDLGEIETADIILRPFYDQDAEVLSITVEVYSTALSSDPQGAQRIETLDVAAAASDREALNTLAEDLALLYQTVFPRRKGTVTSEDNGRILCDLGRRDGIRELIKCVVYRDNGNGGEMISDAWVRSVDESESRAELVTTEPIDFGNTVYVITK